MTYFRYDVAFPGKDEDLVKVQEMVKEFSWPCRVDKCPGGLCVVMIQGKNIPAFYLNDAALELANKIRKEWALPTVVIHKSYVLMNKETFERDVQKALDNIPQSLITSAEADHLFDIKGTAKQIAEEVEDVFDLDSKEAEIEAERAARWASRQSSAKQKKGVIV